MKAFKFIDVQCMVGAERAEVLRRRVLAGERVKLCDVLYHSEYSRCMYRDPADRYDKKVKKE